MDGSLIRILCTGLGVVLLGLIVLRRKQKADE
jgi:hypothetical protein